MKLGGQTSAAIEIVENINKSQRPISLALKDWGQANRYAGSSDRAIIANMVYDVMRKKSSTSYIMQSEQPKDLVLGILYRDWGYTFAGLEKIFCDDKFAPKKISKPKNENIKNAPAEVQADIPNWLIESFENNFSDKWLEEAKALTSRPPLDIRINTQKTSSEKLLKKLKAYKINKTKIARFGLRIKASKKGERQPNIQAEGSFQKGLFEVQDEGSQIVSDLILAKKGEQVLDFCAGAGGKTLALSNIMENKGQIHAYDVDKQRLAPIYQRIKKAGAHNIQVHESEESLPKNFNKVVVDAPCTGTGIWRRHPQTKWKLTKKMLEQRIDQQAQILERAKNFVGSRGLGSGGLLIYITCSILPQENEEQIKNFLDKNKNFELLSLGEAWQELFGFKKPKPWSADMKTITLTPAATNTDGFYMGVMHRLGD